MSISKKLVSNAVYLFLDWFLLTSIGFLNWLVIAKKLLPYDYGIISTLVNFSGIIAEFSLLGLTTAVTKLIPEYLAKKQIKKVNFIMRFPFKMVVPLLLFLIVVFFLFSESLSTILKLPLLAIWSTGVLISLIALSGLFGAIIYGFQRIKTLLLTDILGEILKLVVTLVLIFLGFNYLGPLIGFLLGFSTLALLRFFSIQWYEGVEKVSVKELFLDYTLPAFVSNITWTFFIQGKYVLLTTLKYPELTGIFTVATLLAGVVTIFPNVLNQALFPILSQLSVNHKTKERQKYLISSVVRYSLFITLPITILLISYARQLILIFSRPEYLCEQLGQEKWEKECIPATTLLPILLIGSLSLALAQIFNSTLYAIGKTKVSRNNVIITTIIFFVFAIPLTISHSVFGLAISHVFAALSFFFLTLLYLKKFLKIILPIKDIGKILLATLPSFLFLYLALQVTQGLIISVILVTITFLSYLLLLIPLKFYTKQDVKLLEFFLEKSLIGRSKIKFLFKFLSKHI